MKTTNLFIVSDFYPAGSQRQTFEIDVECKRRGIHVELLCIIDLGKSTVFPDTYYQQHIDLGTKIHFLNEINKPRKYSIIERALIKFGLKKPDKFDLNSFTDQYDQVIFFGEYSYKALAKQFKPKLNEAINLVIVCSRFQGPQYRDFDKSTKFTFIDGFDDRNQVEWEYEGFSNYTSLCLPLSLVPTNQYRNWSFGASKPKKIGIFTRLSKQKPLDPFFYTFSLLLEQIPDLELHIYGAGDPEKAEYDRYIKHLQLTNVYFRGHQENLKQTIVNEKLDLVWFQGYLNRPAGYAGFDVALTGTPQLFWDFYGGENPNINQLNNCYPHYKSIAALARDTAIVLTNQAIAQKISEDQFRDTCENRNMSNSLEIIRHLLK